MGPELDALLTGLILGQPDGATPAADAARAGDAAAAITDAGAAAGDAGVAAATDAASAVAAAAGDAAVAVTDAVAAADAGLTDAAIKAFDAARPIIVDTPPAAPWVEYLVYGVIGALILFFVVRGLRADPKVALETRTDVPRPQLPTHDKTEDEIEREARHAFGRAEAVVPTSGTGRIRIVQKAGTPAPGAIGPKTPAEVPSKGPDQAGQKAPPAAEVPAKAPGKGEGAAAEDTPAAPREEAAGKTLREGLARTRDGFVGKLGRLFGAAKTIDDDLLGDLEEALFTADIGVRTSQKLVDLVHDSLGKKDFDRPDKVWEALKGQIRALLDVGAPALDLDRAKPLVIMVVGVNGAGKTTSIGKLARRYTDEGRKVLLAAGDTFRAAAVEQLEVWADRAGVPVVKGASGQDPSSVIFEAIKTAEREGYDVCICDTAGRLQAKVELMDELAKVHRVSGKAFGGAPHEVWLVLDATNGQNAISQAKVFTEAVAVTGLVLTKLDGTAKGGVIIGISDEMRLPVRYIGIGEKVEDLRAFDADAFAEALLVDS